MAAEMERQESQTTAAALACLDLALAAYREPAGWPGPDAPVSFWPGDGGGDAAYPWTVARYGGFHLPLCPDPAGLGEGITPEQLLIIIDQLLHDAARAYSFSRGLWVCRRHVSAALAGEVRRAAAVRSASMPAPPTG